MRLKLPLVALLIAVAVLLTQVTYTPPGPGQRADGLPPEAVQTLRLIEP